LLLAGLLRVEYGLELGRRLEAGVVRVLLVKIVILPRPQLGGELLEHAGEHAVDRLLTRRVAVPDGDEV